MTSLTRPARCGAAGCYIPAVGRRTRLTVAALATLCTGALLTFLLGAAVGGSVAPAARAGYITVYVSSAAVCLIAGLASHGGAIRWQWLAPALGSVPVAIVVGWWSVTLSDFIALLFYPFAMVAVVQSTGRRPRPALTRRSLDLLVGLTAVVTILLYLMLIGIELPSLYRFLAPGAAVLLVVPAVMQRAPLGVRQGDVSVHLLFGGLLLAAFADLSPFGYRITSVAWACAAWLIAVAASVAYMSPAASKPSAEISTALPTGWWPAAAAAAVYVLIALQLQHIEPPHVRLLATGGTLLTGLILVRQFVALNENDALARAREAQDALFRELVRHSSDAFVVLDAAGRITYCSPALAQLVPRAGDDCRGRHAGDVLAPIDGSTLAAALEFVAQQPGRSHRMTLSIEGASEPPRHVEVIATNRLHEPIAGTVLNIRDITERTRFERLLARNDKMEAVSRMAAGVAHEFNNALTVIMGHVDLLAMDATLRPEDADGLTHIRHAAQRAAHVTGSLLGVSRKRPEQIGAVDANAVIRRVEGMLRSGLGPEHKIVMQTTAALWPASADPDDLEHALLNLALNARDAMPQGGSICITTTNVDAEALPAGTPMPRQDFVRLTVEDTGVGMPEDVLSRVFEPFVSTKPEGQGTGLGLPMVYSAVRRSGGFVDVASAVGQGTTFTLWLPRVAD